MNTWFPLWDPKAAQWNRWLVVHLSAAGFVVFFYMFFKLIGGGTTLKIDLHPRQENRKSEHVCIVQTRSYSQKICLSWWMSFTLLWRKKCLLLQSCSLSRVKSSVRQWRVGDQGLVVAVGSPDIFHRGGWAGSLKFYCSPCSLIVILHR